MITIQTIVLIVLLVAMLIAGGWLLFAPLFSPSCSCGTRRREEYPAVTFRADRAAGPYGYDALPCSTLSMWPGEE